MGMGEPFLNYDRVLAAADLLRCPYGAAIGAAAITISTVGLVPEIDRFTAERRPFRLSISLGAATDAKRAKLVPIAARTPVAEVMAAARRHALDRGDAGHAVLRVHLGRQRVRGRRPGPRGPDRRHPRPPRPDRRHRPYRPFITRRTTKSAGRSATP